MPASPTTTATAAELRGDLGVLAYERMQGAAARGHIGLRVLPPFRVPLQSAQFPRLPANLAMQAVDDARGPAGNYNEIDWPWDFQSYATTDRGLEQRLDDRLLAIYGQHLPVEAVATQAAVDQMLVNHERRVAALLGTTGGSATVTTKWNVPASATPHADVQAAKAAMRLASGLLPNAVAMSMTVFWHLLATAELKAALQYTSPIQMGGFEVQRQAVASYFGVDEVLVAGGLQDTAKKGQSASLADIWGATTIHLLRLAEPGQTNVLEPAYGRTILWTEGSGGGGDAQDGEGMLIVERYRDEARRADMARVRYDVAEFTQYTAAHYKLGNIT